MKNTRIDWRKYRSSLGEILSYPLQDFDSQVQVIAYGTGEFSITVDFVNDKETGEVSTIPVFYGTSVHGAYCFDGAVSINIVPKSKSVRVAAYVSQTGVARREAVDPIPKRLVLPNRVNSFEQSLIRQFTDLLDQRLGGAGGRGREYTVQDEYSDSDDTFGTGFEVDEDLERQLDGHIAARRNSAPPANDKRVQSSDVSSDNKRNGRKLDVSAEGDAKSASSDRDQSARIAELERALADLRKSSS